MTGDSSASGQVTSDSASMGPITSRQQVPVGARDGVIAVVRVIAGAGIRLDRAVTRFSRSRSAPPHLLPDSDSQFPVTAEVPFDRDHYERIEENPNEKS